MGGGKPAGCYFPEMVHPYYVLSDKGVTIDFTTPAENGPAIVGTDFKDPLLVKFLSAPVLMERVLSAPMPDTIDADQYDAIFYTGGHGGMFDFPDDKSLIEIAERIYAKGGLVTAMCHGPAGLLNLKRPDGDYIVKNIKTTGYSLTEEVFYDTLLDIPFVLGEELTKRGSEYSDYGLSQGFVVTDGQVITGQNPMSSHLVGEAIAAALLD